MIEIVIRLIGTDIISLIFRFILRTTNMMTARSNHNVDN